MSIKKSSNTLNMTVGKPRKLLLTFALPLLIGNIIQQLYGLGDMIVVGRILGDSSIAAIGSTGCIWVVSFTIASSFTAGLTIMTTQRFGAKDYDGMRNSMVHALVLQQLVTAIVTALSVYFCRDMLQLLNTHPEIIDDANIYLKVLFWGTPSMILYNLLASFLRSVGNSKVPLYFLIISCIINICCDILFLTVFKWGIAGVAWATNFQQVISGILCLFYIILFVPELRLQRKDWYLERATIYKQSKLGSAMCIHSSVINAGSLFMQYGLNHYGVDSIAGFTIASRINSITFLPLLSFGTAISAFQGQNFGAKRFMRIRVAVRECFIFSIICAVITGTVFVLFGNELVRAFTGEVNPALEKDALTYIYIGIPFYLCLGMLIVYRSAMQGMGKTVSPIVSSFFELAVRISGVFILPIFYGYFGICLTNPLAWVGGLIPVMFAYWMNRKELPKRNLGFGGTKRWIDI